MRITYIKLRNFANIKTALNSDELSIDFTKSKNKIILFTGPNGSGKTSILSCLHPFATNGNLDIRNENSLIIKGKDGYKEIHIQDDDIKYVIKHYYTASKDTHTTKSYIMKNDIELNPNGNVTSFKSIIEDELDIEIDYLKLTRLGGNVTNFIDLKTTERKSFMGKILSEVDIYLKYYKVISNDMREIKSIISHTIDKINKIGILDETEMKKNQKILKKDINSLKDELDKLHSDISILQHEISKYEPPLVIRESITEKRKDISKIEKLIEKLSKKYFDGKFSIDDKNLSQSCNEIIHDLELEIISMKETLQNIDEKREFYHNEVDKYIKEQESAELELEKIQNSTEIEDENQIISSIHDRIERRAKENSLVDYHPSYTKKEMNDVLIMLQRCNDLLLTTYEFGSKPIKKAIDFIISGKDISSYVANNQEKINKNKLQSMSELVFSALQKKFGNVSPNCNEPKVCQVGRFYYELERLATESPDATIEDEVFVTYTKMAYQNIKEVMKYLSEYKDAFNKFPDKIRNMFLLDTVFSHIKKLESFYNREIYFEELSKVTEYELQEEDLNLLKEHREKLKLLKKSITNEEYFEKKIVEYHQNVVDALEKVDEYNDKWKSLKSSLDAKIAELNEMRDFTVSVENYQSLLSSLQEYEYNYGVLTQLLLDLKEKNDKKSILTNKYDKMMSDYTKNDFNLQTWHSLQLELNKYNKKYDEMDLVKSALSSKEGIPLLYIQIYLKNIQEITNELLSIVYDDMYIEDFNITADEFKIPYNTKGSSIRDIAYASQGEKNFISLALSFALIYQSISKYNIMLLDEIDATFDTTNRERFLQILERQMDMIEGEQIFVISHNNMFNMYPVDIIDMHNHKDNENKLANYIKIDLS